MLTALQDKKIAITGASGFLGGHLLRSLAGTKARISCLARQRPNARPLPDFVETVYGDCSTGDGLRELMAGSDILVHMASLLFGLGWEDYLRANALAARNIVRICHAMPEGDRPKKFIFISSLAAAGPCSAPPGVSEGNAGLPVSAYGWSKLISEKIFQAGLPMEPVILRPAIIYGSGDKGLLPMFKCARAGIGISPGAFRKFPVSAIHASDMADAIILAMRNDSHGIYHVDDGQAYDMDIFCGAMAQAQGVKKLRMLHMPLPIMALTAASCTLSGRLGQKINVWLKNAIFMPPHWNMDKYREAAAKGWLGDAFRIRGELGFIPRINLEQGMTEAVAGYRGEGWL